jgi:hypothetical protein
MAYSIILKKNVYIVQSWSPGMNLAPRAKPIKVMAKFWTCNRLGADVCTHEGTFTMDWSKCAMSVVMMHIAYQDVNMMYLAGDFIGCYNVVN